VTRSFPERPIVGVGAVIVDGDRVLLARRAHEPLKGSWSLPGGAIEVGETLHAALVREVREETGLTIEVGPIVEVIDRIHVTEDGRVEYHYVVVDYLCRAIGSHEPVSGSDADDVRWVRTADLPEYHLTEKAAEVIRKAFVIYASMQSTPARRRER
jgi:8-oxo-dGTP diphosphatase